MPVAPVVPAIPVPPVMPATPVTPVVPPIPVAPVVPAIPVAPSSGDTGVRCPQYRSHQWHPSTRRTYGTRRSGGSDCARGAGEARTGRARCAERTGSSRGTGSPRGTRRTTRERGALPEQTGAWAEAQWRCLRCRQRQVRNLHITRRAVDQHPQKRSGAVLDGDIAAGWCPELDIGRRRFRGIADGQLQCRCQCCGNRSSREPHVVGHCVLPATTRGRSRFVVGPLTSIPCGPTASFAHASPNWPARAATSRGQRSLNCPALESLPPGPARARDRPDRRLDSR